MSIPSVAPPGAAVLDSRRQEPVFSEGELIRLENITKTYQLGTVEVPVLKGVSLSIRRGEMVALMGASGSGKTTLMNILGCMDRPTSGEFWLDGQEMSRLAPDERAAVRSAKLGFVFQSFNLLPRIPALQNVLMPLDYAAQRVARHAARDWAEDLLEEVGLAERIEHTSSQMSGGQQQRVAIARALVNRPALVLADEPTGNLDSRTGEEILRMFQRLNAQGITVILVTHDPKVAGYADRTIRIADGLIEEADADGADAENRAPFRNWADFSPTPHKPHPPGRHFIPSILRTAVGNLHGNKMRSALTTLCIVMGVGAVIAMTEIGQGSKATIEATIASMGAKKVPIYPAAVNNGGVNQGAGTFQTLKPDDVEAIARECPAAEVVVPLVFAQAQVIYGGQNCFPGQLTGTGPGYLATRDWEELEEGVCFGPGDVETSNTVCVIGQTVKEELFGDQSPIGKIIRIRNVPFRVIGLLARHGASMGGQDQDDCVIAPWTTIKFRVNGVGAGSTKPQAATVSTATVDPNNIYPQAMPLYPQASTAELADVPQPVRQLSVDMIQAKAASIEDVPIAIDQISALLRQRHHLQGDDQDDFKILNMTEVARTSEQSSDLMSSLLLIVAAISLLVGGVGIMNIMLVSVTQRTREIGLRMAVGARRHHILRQFLLEAVLLCLAGGVVGVAVGCGASYLVRELLNWATVLSIPAIVGSVGVSAAVGVIFGFYPAWKASRMDPIAALRYE